MGQKTDKTELHGGEKGILHTSCARGMLKYVEIVKKKKDISINI